MSAEERLREGNLAQALDELQKRVKSNPADAKERLFLFQLLATLGQWDRAANQLKLSAELDSGLLILAQIYRQAIAAEAVRSKVFAGSSSPVFMGEPASWAALLLEALKLSGTERYEQAAELREQALAQAPATRGTINGDAFEWIADADARFGPCLELIVDGKYVWAPFEKIRSVKMEPPSDLRDVVWMQAIVTWSNGGQAPALIPTRYPGSEKGEKDALRLSRLTEWSEPAPGTYIGFGQRMLATDAGEYPLLEVREIVLDTIQAAAPAGE
jgi:type VI secretion system protein ImpE